MIFVKENRFGLIDINFMPFDPLYGEKDEEGIIKNKEQLEKEGLLVNDIPMPEVKEGKTSIIKADMKNKTVYYKYVDSPKVETKKEEITALKEQIAENKIQSLITNKMLMENTKELAKVKLELIKTKQNGGIR